VVDRIFLGFWKEEFFLYNFTYFFPKILTRGWAINKSLTISAIQHIFGVLEREFHCEYFMFYKFVDMMSRSLGNIRAALANMWHHIKMAKNSKKNWRKWLKRRKRQKMIFIK